MRLFDLHCDTLTEMRNRGCGIAANDLHISYEKSAAFSPYVQVAAVWSDSSLSDEDCLQRFPQVLSHYGGDFITDRASLEAVAEDGGRGLILAVEGARLLCGDIGNLDYLYSCGVRFLTLTWAHTDIIGGAHGTDTPLTPFGREVVEKCFDLGIVPDVSHASRKVCAEVTDMARHAGKRITATHSNSFSVHNHERNLTDREFSDIISLGGIAGISLAPEHLGCGPVGIGDTVRHILHYISVGGISSVALGCDFDGIGSTPEGLGDISRLPRLYDALVHAGLSEDDADRVFWKNAFDFARDELR